MTSSVPMGHVVGVVSFLIGTCLMVSGGWRARGCFAGCCRQNVVYMFNVFVDKFVVVVDKFVVSVDKNNEHVRHVV